MPQSFFGRALFFEDFDAHSVAAAAAPAQAAPMFSDAELSAACEASRADGCRQGLEQARSEAAASQVQALAAIAAALGGAAAAARATAEERAAEVARLLLATLGALFPALCARFGATEAASIARALAPALRHEPAACVRVHPDSCAELAAALDAVDPELRAMLRLVASEAVAPGDLRIEWQNGAAVRDGAALWRAATAVLAPLDLLGTAEPPTPPPAAAVEAAVAAAPLHPAMAE